MKRTLLTFLLSTVVGFGIVGCGSSSSVPSTMGGACNDMGAAFCQAELRCTTALTQSDCVAAFVQGCCQDDGICGKSTSSVDSSTYAQCKSDLAGMSCADIIAAATGTLPSSCSAL